MIDTRIQWKCRRGMLELDLIFAKFFQQKFPQLSSNDQNIFERLLDEQDPELAAWIFYNKISPNDEYIKLIESIKNCNICEPCHSAI